MANLKEIAKMYGSGIDYYDMNSGRIYHLSQSTYDAKNNTTSVPVTVDGDFIGNATMEGKIEED